MILAAALAIAACSEPPASSGPDPKFVSRLPKPGENNVWYERTDSSTAIIFVHGILGDSRGTWLYAGDSGPMQYWPDLVVSDPAFSSVSVYLGGYYTAVDAQLYDGRDAADELLGALRRDAVLKRQNILFICHSTGGIVARYMLYHNREEFADTRIGLLLIASPSHGSGLADTLNPLIEIFNNKMGSQLRWNSAFLDELDGNFKNLVHQKLIPHLVGREAVENHFVVHRRWLPNRRLVVEPESAGRYFARPMRLPDTDHWSAVKPPSRKHPAYELLADFYAKDFRGMIGALAEAKVRELKERISELYGVYESTSTYGTASEAARIVRRDARPLAAEILRVDDSLLGHGYLIAKYEYAAFPYMLAASTEARPKQARQLADDSLDAASRALQHTKDVERAATLGNSDAQRIERWLRESQDANRVRLVIAISHAIRARAGGGSGRQDVEMALRQVDPDYLQRFPGTVHPDVRQVLGLKPGRR